MKRISVVVLSKDSRKAVDDLKKLGLVHFQLTHAASGDIQTLKSQEQEVRKVMSLVEIPKGTKAARPESYGGLEQGLSVIRAVNGKGDTVREIDDKIDRIQRELDRLTAWGDVSPEDFQELKASGISLTLVVYRDSEDTLPSELEYFVVKREKGRLLLAVLGDRFDQKALQAIPMTEIVLLPQESTPELKTELGRLGAERQELVRSLKSDTALPGVVLGVLSEVESKTEFAQVEALLKNEGELSWITGFLPAESVDRAKFWSAESGWAILIDEPEEEDPVPTLVRSPGPGAMAQPVLKFLGTLPDYRGSEISSWFVYFLIIFFAMLINDAGYGALIIVISLVMAVSGLIRHRKVSAFTALMMCFGVAAFAWGAVTGTWFGVEELSKEAPFNQFIVPWLYAYDHNNQANVTLLSFVIGIIHLSLAHLLRFVREVREKPHFHAFAQLGWVAVLNVAFLLVINLIVSATRFPLPGFAIPLAGAGILVIVLFEGQEGDGFLRGIGRSLARIIETLINVIGSFADVISYIRLFAVGLAGFYIAESFNNMAAGMMSSGPVGLGGGILVALAGHTLNLALGALAIIVHGIRLNMLEFTHHVHLEWSGFEYRPFAARGAEQ